MQTKYKFPGDERKNRILESKNTYFMYWFWLLRLQKIWRTDFRTEMVWPVYTDFQFDNNKAKMTPFRDFGI